MTGWYPRKRPACKVDPKIKTLLMCLIPALTPLFLFGFYPLGYAFYLSFTFYNLKSAIPPHFTGLGNFIGLISDSVFKISVTSNIIFALITIPLITLVSLGEALLLSKDFRGVKFMQVLALIPWGIPLVVSGSIYRFIFDLNFGLFNHIMVKLGLIDVYQSWLSMKWPALLIVALAYLWVQTPLPTLLFLAGIQSIPPELYEAALIDGAKPLARFKIVTFNWLKPIFFIVLVYASLMALWVFDPIYVITSGGPANFTKLLTYYTYEKMFYFLNFGQAGAATIIIFSVTVILIYLYFRALRLGRLRLKV
jgi:ABC-type sugar transport system permease subunit